jgi:glucose-6-phosphate 1-dehydrogenase
MPPTIFVLFGATGDLARRMVLPAFAALAVNDLMPEQWVLIGNGRKDQDDAWFADHVRDVLDDDKAYAAVEGHLMFAGNGFSVDDPGDLPATVARAREQVGEDALLVHYIALPPSTFEPYVQALDAHGLAKGARVVFEKPYGTSPSAFDHLEQVVHGVLDEEQVYRLDHFLGKEATQNLHVLRFTNAIIGDVWCNRGVRQVQIDVPETLDIDDRAEFYDATGATLDMVVTHLFQVATEIAMEPPPSLGAGDLLEARESVIACFRPLDPDEVVLGQYDGYRDVEGSPTTPTPTRSSRRGCGSTRTAGGVPYLRGDEEAGPGPRVHHQGGPAAARRRRGSGPPGLRHPAPRRPRRRPLAVHLQRRAAGDVAGARSAAGEPAGRAELRAGLLGAGGGDGARRPRRVVPAVAARRQRVAR